jgi:hypothetical protein
MAAIGVSAIFIGHIPSGQHHITYFRPLQESPAKTLQKRPKRMPKESS